MEVLVDALKDSIRMLPFLLGAFCIMELLEKYSTERRRNLLGKFRKAGPVIGAAFGCVPQCGFSVAAANLYAGGIISVGTLLSVFMSTSDEAVLIMLGYPGSGKKIMLLVAVKVILAVCAGYIVDIFFAKNMGEKKDIQELCEKQHCGCKEHQGILGPACRHTVRLFAYILLFTLLINLVVEGIGKETLRAAALSGTIVQPFLTACVGLIPNCASSVLLTELYMKGILNFASTVSGLCTSAGIGLVVLFKVNQPQKENWKIVGMLYAASVIAGMLLYCLPIS